MVLTCLFHGQLVEHFFPVTHSALLLEEEHPKPNQYDDQHPSVTLFSALTPCSLINCQRQSPSSLKNLERNDPHLMK